MSKSFSRRGFLRLSGMAVAGATLAACAPAGAPAASTSGEGAAPDAAGKQINIDHDVYGSDYLEFAGKADQFKRGVRHRGTGRMIN